jgi:hypothetical protein
VGGEPGCVSEERELPSGQAGEQRDRQGRYELHGGLAALVTEHARRLARDASRDNARA